MRKMQWMTIMVGARKPHSGQGSLPQPLYPARQEQHQHLLTDLPRTVTEKRVTFPAASQQWKQLLWSWRRRNASLKSLMTELVVSVCCLWLVSWLSMGCVVCTLIGYSQGFMTLDTCPWNTKCVKITFRWTLIHAHTLWVICFMNRENWRQSVL